MFEGQVDHSASDPPNSEPGFYYSRMERLPEEILDAVCTLLAPPSATRADIASFSLVSKRCAKAASRRRLERIIITIGTTSKLRQDVNELVNILSRSARFGCVRQMKLRVDPPQTVENRSQLVRRDRQTAEDEDSEIDDEDDHDICRLPRLGRGRATTWHGDDVNVFSNNVYQGQATPEDIREISRRFWPLSDLIEKLRSLTDLVWDCDHHMPICLLRVLKCWPRARLHMHKFRLRDGCLPGRDLGENDPNADEYALVTSHSLHTVVWKRWGGQTHGKMNDALWCMLRGAAPNLRHVVLNWCGPSQHSYRCLKTPDFEATNVKAKLETLSIDAVQRTELLYWASLVDFNELRTLRLRGVLAQGDTAALQDIIKKYGIGNLCTFELRHESGIWGEATTPVSQLLVQMPPLEHIDFTGTLNSQESPAILAWHGPRLKILELKLLSQERTSTALLRGLQDIVDMERHCPLLERVDLNIARTHGDRRELAIYEALARMPRLRHVELRLDCSMRTTNPRLEEHTVSGEGGVQLSFNDYRMALTNTAIDHNLAVSIFNIFGPQLEYLRIKPRGQGELGRAWYDEQAMEVLDWIGRDWVVRRGPWGRVEVSRGGCVREGPNGGGPWRGESLLRADFGHEPGFDDERRDDLREIWTSIWPGLEGDRTEQWESILLANPNQELY